MNAILMWIIAISAALGGLDKIFGNRFGLGKRFDEGFRLLGPLVSGMVGILCLTPLLSKALQFTAAPVFRAVGLDPALLAGLLPIDMGGYPLAVEIADDPRVGLFSGIIIASTLGCTLIFSIPVGFGMMKLENRRSFIFGIMIGLIAIPVTLLTGGLLCGLGLVRTVTQSLPVVLFALLLGVGVRLNTERMICIFMIFARIIEAVSVIGVIAGLIEYLTGFSLIPGIRPLRDAMPEAALCGIFLAGSLPFAEIVGRLLRAPLNELGARLRLRDDGVTGLLLNLVSIPAAFGVMHDMTEHDIAFNAAFLVSAGVIFGPHLGVCAAYAPEMVTPFILAKLIGGIFTAVLAQILLRQRPRTEA